MTFSSKLYRLASIVFPIIAFIVAIIGAYFADPYLAFVSSSWVIYGLLALSLDVVWGRGGFLCLAQTALFGIGGYCGSIVAINVAPIIGSSLIVALPMGALFGAFAAYFLGLVIFYARMGELQSTILSYTFTILIWSLAQSFKIEIGQAKIAGDSGLSNIPGIVIGFGANSESLGPNAALIAIIIVAFVLYFITRGLMRSNFGRVIDCIRIDIEKTELLGYNTRRYQLVNFIFAGALAGLAGALFALWSNFLSPSVFSVQEALLVPIYVLVGGLGTLSGGFVGAAVIGSLSFLLGGGAGGGQTTLILGLILICLVLFLKNGLLGTIDKLWKKNLPDPNLEVRNTNTVKIEHEVLEKILEEAQKVAGPAKKIATDKAFKQFGGVIPVNNVSREFAPGQPYSLIGPNGAGKSSFLKTCIGIYPPDKGAIYLADEDITKEPIFRRVNKGMGVKNQKPQVFGDLSVIENLWVAAFSRSRNNEQAIEISEKILNMLGLQNQSGVEASALSHGQQQWLDIGMVLCLAPRVVLFDEPAAGMTSEETRELSLLIRTLANYTTVVVVEHDMEFIRTLNGHVTVLHQGKVFAEGDIDTLRSDDRVLDIYLGRGTHV